LISLAAACFYPLTSFPFFGEAWWCGKPGPPCQRSTMPDQRMMALQEQPPVNLRLGINHQFIKQLEMPSTSINLA
jgi:hypothetical protein